jgi:hypothetical protein
VIVLSLWHLFLHLTGISNVSGPWYGFWSGFGSDLGLLGAVVIFVRHQNCHVKGCWRIGRHPYQHYRLCSKHHPAVPGRVTHEHIKALAAAAADREERVPAADAVP